MRLFVISNKLTFRVEITPKSPSCSDSLRLQHFSWELVPRETEVLEVRSKTCKFEETMVDVQIY